MNAVVCACGRRYEYELSPLSPIVPPMWDLLKTDGHDPDECSRAIGYQGRFDGRAEMVDAAMKHFAERRSLSGAELAEIRAVLAELARTLPLIASDDGLEPIATSTAWSRS